MFFLNPFSRKEKLANKNGLYNAIEIAQYVINHSIGKGKPVNNLKLQKILYYIQAAFLVEEGVSCFKENIVNWRHGPVVKEVYDEYKDYIDSNIDDEQRGYYKIILDKDNLRFKSEFIEFDSKIISDKHKELIDKVVDSMLDFDAWELVKRTQNEKPWKEDSRRNEVIPIESIKKYFKENKSKIYGGQY